MKSIGTKKYLTKSVFQFAWMLSYNNQSDIVSGRNCFIGFYTIFKRVWIDFSESGSTVPDFEPPGYMGFVFLFFITLPLI